MKFLSFVLFFIIATAFCGSGEKPVLQDRGPYFWQAEKEGKTFHILGTMHVGVSMDDLQCSDQITNYLKTSDLVFLEFNERNLSQLRNKITAGLSDRSGNSYQSFNEKSRQFLEKTNFPSINALSYYGLLYVLHNICISNYPDLVEKFVLLNSSSLDKQIQEIAQSQNIKQDYLDSLKEVSSIFELNRQAVTLEQVETFIDDYDVICSETNFEKALSVLFITANRFKSGDLSLDFTESLERQHGLHKDTPLPGSPPFDDEVVTNTMQGRNDKWVKKLISAHSVHNNIFVAGGLFHFETGGKASVLDGLTKAGYSVSRINDNCMIQ